MPCAKLGVANGRTNATAATALRTFRLVMIELLFRKPNPTRGALVPAITPLCV
jgi:hypothetical protein